MNKTFALIFILSSIKLFAQKKIHHYHLPTKHNVVAPVILPGAYQVSEYLPLLVGKRVGVFANQTSTIGNTHLIDTLKSLGITITKVFAPEHGFRGTADAGAQVDNYIDTLTGIKVVSLYGKKTKPSLVDVHDIDVLLFDVQDVGVRFYTFISSLQGFMESAIQYNKPLIVLDRPNPNGFYVDGPVLNKSFSSFVGMQPIPVVYGMTIGEYANMILGEGWLDWKYVRKEADKLTLTKMLGFDESHKNFKLTIIPCKNYNHNSKYQLPIKPSPNLPDMNSVYWYPSTCFFEGTVISEGRGTDHPFCTIGHPLLPDTLFAFTPSVREGAKEPKFKNQLCYGWLLPNIAQEIFHPMNNHLQLNFLLKSYQLFPKKDSFFITPSSGITTDYFFNKLAGNNQLMQQIKQGKTDEEIRQSWQPALLNFNLIRKKYLLYQDFN